MPANHDGINLHASIFCKNEGFGAENPGTRPNSGQLKLLGGIQQYFLPLNNQIANLGAAGGRNGGIQQHGGGVYRHL